MIYWSSVNERGAVAQLGERYNRTVEVKGSSPFSSTPVRLDALQSNCVVEMHCPQLAMNLTG